VDRPDRAPKEKKGTISGPLGGGGDGRKVRREAALFGCKTDMEREIFKIVRISRGASKGGGGIKITNQKLRKFLPGKGLITRWI